ncbi:hypothetical protein PsYK624_048890 [Phanerochaete sordida]|uniref:Uncharacterized protein n=1 Tax=Phanerochaete sordida TaxID=48140 RepID=A0A9P3G663_9APHY|nr:hypothetical protein PsYK624_048890 [Phanerochaete sordida]
MDDTTEAARTAPVFTGDVLNHSSSGTFPQRALYGHVVTPDACDKSPERAVYINTNAPFSALICGLQGSGKSHSTSVILESCLIEDPRSGALPAPLSTLVFHFDGAAGSGSVQACEAAYLASLDADRGGHAKPPSVTVLVLPSNLETMKRAYAALPNVEVKPLFFGPRDISGERLLSIMRVDKHSQPPIYMENIKTIFRSMEPVFDYQNFRRKLGEISLKGENKIMLDLRLTLLDSCINGKQNTKSVSSDFKKGQLTIVDLSSPLMDSESACSFFELVLSLFVEADVEDAGKLVALDQAHNYLSQAKAGSSARLTNSILSVIRQQRHLAARVVISTQEPTVIPSQVLELSSIILAHRFSSPAWMEHLSRHLSPCRSAASTDLFDKIAALGSGEAILFAPSGLALRPDAPSESGIEEEPPAGKLVHIGNGHIHVKCRPRITSDGGHAILAVPHKQGTRLPRVSASPPPADGAEITVAERAMKMAREKSQTAAKGATADPAFNVAQYIVNRFTVHCATELSLENVRKAFKDLGDCEFEDALRRAEEGGLLRREDKRILPPRAPGHSAAPTSRPDAAAAPEAQSLVEFVKSCMKLGTTKVSFDTVRDYFSKNRQGVSEIDIWAVSSAALCAAENAGHIATVVENDKQWITLPGTTKLPSSSVKAGAKSFSTLATAAAAAVAAISLTGKHKRFEPLVRFVLARHSTERRPVKLAAVHQYFSQKDPSLYGKKLKAFNQVASEAIKQGLLSGVPGAAKDKAVTSVMPVPGAKYEIEVL